MSARAHGVWWRWGAVGALVAVLAALPAIVGALPASDAAVPAADLRDAAVGSADVGFSGYAVSAGGLRLPVTQQLTEAADLFSDRTTMRVWWRGADDHRVDVLGAAGETGVHRDAGGTWTWDYESSVAARGEPASLALPSPPDLLPSSLGRRLLSEATGGELTRIGARRVAGRDALGLRLVPAEPGSSVDRVDVWVDRATGLPLQVEVVAAGARQPALDTRFLDLDLGVPPASVVAFTPPADARIVPAPDPLSAALDSGRSSPAVQLPAALAGLPRRPLEGVPPAVGVYGRGVTQLAVVPVSPGNTSGLRRALHAAPGSVVGPAGVRLAAGPLAVMLVETPDLRAFLLAGTVTLDAVAEAGNGIWRLRPS
ncbi:transcriptional regulator [Geodermatophilus sabuli]|uniref:Transcriptional regulator n=1 Tax=Geodermatophilus sabuli TaxID=1564158 RepID=A0A7K3W6B0_9ACTN|nr:transcriptional regulator [Geodermatophilus sabuli]NEK60396.1 transcriptional regulator [Geodermatophilus sabuli]